MIYAVLFACAIALGWLSSYRMGGSAERETMCLLTCAWVATIIANNITGSLTPVEFYAPIDLLAIFWLLVHQRRNWQWIPAGLFATMLMVHGMQWSGSHIGVLDGSGRPYQDILAGLAYMQVFSVGLASYERARARNQRTGFVGRWLLAGNWVPFGSYSHRNNARSV